MILQAGSAKSVWNRSVSRESRAGRRERVRDWGGSRERESVQGFFRLKWIRPNSKPCDQNVEEVGPVGQFSPFYLFLPTTRPHWLTLRAILPAPFPAPSSKLCQISLRHWRGTLYLRAAVHRRGQRPPKGLGTNKTAEATSVAPSPSLINDLMVSVDVKVKVQGF